MPTSGSFVFCPDADLTRHLLGACLRVFCPQVGRALPGKSSEGFASLLRAEARRRGSSSQQPGSRELQKLFLFDS